MTKDGTEQKITILALGNIQTTMDDKGLQVGGAEISEQGASLMANVIGTIVSIVLSPVVGLFGALSQAGPSAGGSD